jgi:hypothetical protein
VTLTDDQKLEEKKRTIVIIGRPEDVVYRGLMRL